MPLARARCAACTLPLSDAPHSTVSAPCGRCGLESKVAMAADGQPVDFDVAFTAPRLLGWFAAARAAMANGTPGVAVGACSACQAPLVISSRQAIELHCPHCKEPVKGATAEVLVDQWPEPWARVEGGPLDLEYRLELLDSANGITAGCAACGEPTPPNDPATRCRRCGAVVWAVRPNGSRVQLGVRVNGARAGRPFKALVPILQGESMLRADLALGRSEESGRSMLRISGIGCAIAIALTTVFALAIGLLVHFLGKR